MGQLPRAVPQLDVEDGFVVFMKEAWRCLVPGGTAHFRLPFAGNPRVIADPLCQRYFNRGTFVHFARPEEEMENEWKWDQYGPDYGMRFVMIRAAEDRGCYVICLEKPND